MLEHNDSVYLGYMSIIADWRIRCQYASGNAWNEQFRFSDVTVVVVIIIIIIERHVSSTHTHLSDYRDRLYAVLGSTAVGSVADDCRKYLSTT